MRSTNTVNVFQAALADLSLRAKLDELLDLMLAQYRSTMQHGTDAQRQQLIRANLPQLVREHERRSRTREQKDAAMGEAFNRMRDGYPDDIRETIPEWPTNEERGHAA